MNLANDAQCKMDLGNSIIAQQFCLLSKCLRYAFLHRYNISENSTILCYKIMNVTFNAPMCAVYSALELLLYKHLYLILGCDNIISYEINI